MQNYGFNTQKDNDCVSVKCVFLCADDLASRGGYNYYLLSYDYDYNDIMYSQVHNVPINLDLYLIFTPLCQMYVQT